MPGMLRREDASCQEVEVVAPASYPASLASAPVFRGMNMPFSSGLHRVFRLLAVLLATLCFDAQHGMAQGSKQDPLMIKRTSTKPPTDQKGAKDVDVSATREWTDTGIDLAPGDRLVITATGTLQFPNTPQAAGPDGLPRGWKDLLRNLPVNESGRGALIGRIGDTDTSEPFLVGARRELLAPRSGRLFLGINQQQSEPGTGTFHARIEFLQRGAKSTEGGSGGSTAVGTEVPGVNKALLEKIPRRVADADGHPGDMVNFLILGSEDRVRQALQTAGWVVVDRSKKDAVLHGILASLSKQAYVQLPMSELFLFGRAQDFGFAHAEPFAVVAQRHHFRLWKASMEVNGQTLWVGAGTHDIGIEKDKRNGKLTHKIDPAVDGERDYIGRSLTDTGMVTAITYVQPSNPVTDTKTATGDSFHSDGRVMAMSLASSGDDRSKAFAEIFCAVLQQEHPDAGDWGPCSEYLESPPSSRASLGAFPAKYRLLIVPGVMSSCASSAPAYKEGQAYLHDHYGLPVALVPAPNESSETNGQSIAQYLRDHWKEDTRKYILLGYSKGAPDIQVALAQDPDIVTMVAAFITVAGAVGGSPVADAMPAQAERWTQSLNLGACQGDIAAAFKSLGRTERQTFLANHPTPPVPTYSLVAISDKTNTSKALLQSWQLMSVYDSRQDSQLTQSDATAPGALYLGAARADHFAVALPFESLQDASVRALVDKNHYPRTALLEALVRFVGQDLESPK